MTQLKCLYTDIKVHSLLKVDGSTPLFMLLHELSFNINVIETS